MSADTVEVGSPVHTRRGLAVRLRPLWAVLSPQRPLLVATVAAGALKQLLTIASAVVSAYLVGQAATGATTGQLRAIFVALIALVVPTAVMPWLESWLGHMMAFRMLVDVRDQVHRAFVRLSPGYLLHRRSGDLASAVMADVELLEIFFAHTLSPVVVAVTVPLAALVTLAVLHWSLPLLLTPVLVVLATVPAWLRRRAEAQGLAVRGRAGEVNAELVDGVQGLREITAFGDERHQLDRLRNGGTALLEAQVAHARRVGVERAAIDILVALGLLVVLGAAAGLTASGALAPALFPTAVVLGAFTFAPVTTVVRVAGELNLVAAAGERLFTILAEPAPVSDRDPLPPQPTRIEPRIAFDAVGFRYAAELPDVLTDVSFSVAAGETVALVGQSGAGKSTTAHLLLRFWDVTSGAIRVSGHDIRDLSQERLHDLTSFVPQDVYLFHTSVRDNIRLGRADATDEEVERAARRSLAHDFITALPDGYDTVTGERGARLSGGQRQRIALARALLHDAPILVMDEAVSNLDAASERELATAMARVSSTRTTVIIAHRLSTIRAADRVVVLEGGTVTETGVHADLLSRGGAYARLIGSQAFAPDDGSTST